MASKPVAVEADIVIVAGTVAAVGTTLTSWVPGQPTVTKQYAKLTVGGQPVISQVKCTFTYTGIDNSTKGPAQVNPETLTLTAADLGTTKLQQQEDQVLRDGDTIESTFGNTIKIVSSRKLQSS
jgi:hypothetical protein